MAMRDLFFDLHWGAAEVVSNLMRAISTANGNVDVSFLFLQLQRQLCEVLVSFRSAPGIDVIFGSFQFRGAAR